MTLKSLKDLKTQKEFKVKKGAIEELNNITKPKKTGNKINDLITRGLYILNMDNLNNEDVVPLSVESVKGCLKVIIKEAHRMGSIRAEGKK